MFKYLIKKQYSLIKTSLNTFCTKEGRKKSSLLETLREKFSLKGPEKIDYSNLKITNEKQDEINASKLENVEQEEEWHPEIWLDEHTKQVMNEAAKIAKEHHLSSEDKIYIIFKN